MTSKTYKKVLSKIGQYLLNQLLALDLLVNSLTGGDPRETLSSRFGKEIRDEKNGTDDGCRICTFICRWLDVLDSRHCEKSIVHTVGSKEVIDL